MDPARCFDGRVVSYTMNMARDSFLQYPDPVTARRSSSRPVAQRTKGIRAIPGNAHRKSGERSNAGALVVCRHHRCPVITDGEHSVGITDADFWAILDLHAAIGVVDGLDHAKVLALKELGDDNLTNAWLKLDAVAHYLDCSC